MDIKTIALILLIGRIISVILMSRVLWIQIRLLRENTPPSIQATRIILFAFALALTVGNFVPVLIDLATILAAEPQRNDPKLLSVFYALSNMFTSLVGAIFFTFLYREAKAGNVMITEHEQKKRK